MSKINELRNQRAKAWEDAKKFLDSHRNDKNILSNEDTQKYERMEQEIVSLGKEIEREERIASFERELNMPINSPLTSRPNSNLEKEGKTGRGSKEYTKAFWSHIRSRDGIVTPEIRNALQLGAETEGGYLVPDEYENTIIQALAEQNIFREMAHNIRTSSGDRKIPIVTSKGTASWIEEEGIVPESDDAFGQITIGANKLGTMIKVSEELLSDSVFDIEGYISNEFVRRIGEKEEDAFINGDGSHKPLGILSNTGGADVGITAASSTALTADEVIDLYYSLKAPYRKNAIWLLNDSTIKAIRKLKDSNGQYIWQPGIVANSTDTILGRPVKTSSFMPELVAGNKTIAFGDFSFYWIADRSNISFKRLGELYAPSGQVGFLGSERVDGKLTLAEAIKVLKQKATA